MAPHRRPSPTLPSSAPTPLTYNPVLLLDPKAAKKHAKDKTASARSNASSLVHPHSTARRSKNMAGTEKLNGSATPPLVAPSPSRSPLHPATEQHGMASMIEKMHGVERREDRPVKRQKFEQSPSYHGNDPEEVEHGDFSNSSKKTAFKGGAGSSELGRFLKEERAKDFEAAMANGNLDLDHSDSKEAVAATPQEAERDPMGDTLTVKAEDESKQNTDDVVVINGPIVKEEVKDEVCLGRLDKAWIKADKLPSTNKPPLMRNNQIWPSIKVTLERSPGSINFCIVAKDPSGASFGKLDQRVATPLSKLIDGWKVSRIRLSARLDSRKRDPYEFEGLAISKALPVTIHIYAPSTNAKPIGNVLASAQIQLLDPLVIERGVTVFNPHKEFGAIPQLKNKIVPVRPEERSSATTVQRTNEQTREDVLEVFDSLADTKDMPCIEASNLVLTPLLPHQKQALWFMTERERQHILPVDDQALSDTQAAANKHRAKSIWQRRFSPKGKTTWLNVITGHEQDKEPEPSLGGIIADVMGLGKTLNVLALCTKSQAQAIHWQNEIPAPDIQHASVEQEPLLRSRATLLICPLTTIVNWEDQIKTHLKINSLKFYVYQGPKRTDDPEELADHDMVITTYSTVSADMISTNRKRLDSPLFRINWFRIVLDEAHTIRNQTTSQFKAACSLEAPRRWCLTGTPVQNRLDDLGALIKFLKIKPFDVKNMFSEFITRPLKNSDADTITKLRLLVDSITLRRLKDKIDLPERVVEVVTIKMTYRERMVYDQFKRQTNLKLGSVIDNSKQGKVSGKMYSHILRVILRLRQLAACGADLLNDEDWDLVKGSSEILLIDLSESDDDKSPRQPKEAFEMLEMMEDAGVNNCAKCNCAIDSTEENVVEDEDETEMNNDHDGDGTDSPEDGNDGPLQEDPDSDYKPKPEILKRTKSKTFLKKAEKKELKDMAQNPDCIAFLTPCNQLLCPKCHTKFQEQMRRRVGPDNFGPCLICEQYIRATCFPLLKSEIEKNRTLKDEMRKKQLGKKLTRYGGLYSKTAKLIEFLEADDQISKADPNEKPIKSVVFSEWITHLDLVELGLRERGISWQRLDGKMSIKQRQQALSVFSESPAVNVILISTKAGGLGINLTAACRVYVMQPSYNPGVERQTVERVHRLGQTRKVIIRHMVMEDSIEGKMRELQAKKEELAKFSFDNKESKEVYIEIGKNEAAKERLSYLRDLFR